MKWFLAKLVYRIICGEGLHTPQFDEQLRLIWANDVDEAWLKAVEMGASGEDTFFNTKEQLVRWQFINVSELYRMGELIDGAELYSRINEVDDAESYMDLVHRKADSIRQKNTHHLLNLI